ncbi:hypothetical protein SMQE13_09060 [Serratia marcescens]|nr:hypothetical protein SMQE13_09060 [Serratia marcescens]
MSLRKLNPAGSYFEFMDRNNIDGGLCVGMSMSWIIKRLGEGCSDTSPPESELELKQATLFQRDSWKVYANQPDSERLKWVGGKLDDDFNHITYEVEVRKGTFGPFKSSGEVKAKLNVYLSDKVNDVCCLLNFESSPGNGHAVAIFQSSIRQKCYFYDPNFGVYLWEPTGCDLYEDLKKHFITAYHKKYTLIAALFVKAK